MEKHLRYFLQQPLPHFIRKPLQRQQKHSSGYSRIRNVSGLEILKSMEEYKLISNLAYL